MSVVLYKPTKLLPASVSQELRKIVDAELDAPKGSYRVVQILVPSSPAVHACVYPDDRFVDEDSKLPRQDLADAAGSNRSYKFATVPPGAYIPLRLTPEQTLWAAAEINLAEVSVVIEYHLSAELVVKASL